VRDQTAPARAYHVPALVVPCAAVGVLADGTPYFGPIGQVVSDDSRVLCHLCGSAFKSVAAHLRSHGWTKVQYCQAFGLERSQSLEGAQTRKLRAAAFSARLVFEPALRAGSAVGRQRARAGDLARDAAAAARGRPFPQQRRERSRQAASDAARARIARANRDRADRNLARIAGQAARRQGYESIGRLVADQLGAGQSLAAISLGCGLNKDWMSRHLGRVDPAAAELARSPRPRTADARWLPVIRGLGFDDVGNYLRQRHIVEHESIHGIAREARVSTAAVKSALERHGLTAWPHAAKRHAARQREQEVAAALGAESIADFVRSGRLLGRTWRDMAAESGQPETWLRRHAAGGARLD
jgi:hypothetical protein